MCWNWLRKMRKRGKEAPKEEIPKEEPPKEEAPVGEVIEVRYVLKGFTQAPVTVFSLKLDNGQIERAAMPGHSFNLRNGDKIRFLLDKGQKFANEERTSYKAEEDGTQKLVCEEIWYYLITEYKLLAPPQDSSGDKVPELGEELGEERVSKSA